MRYLWVNYHRLFVGGMDDCTTLFDEALHWSMQIGVDGVRPNISLTTPADLMTTKAERKGKNTAKKMQIR